MASEANPIGEQMVQGIVEGVLAAAPMLYDTMRSVMNAARAEASSAIDARSPSRLFRDAIGKNIGLGVAEGISETGAIINKSMSDVLSGLKNIADYEIKNTLRMIDKATKPPAPATTGYTGHGQQAKQGGFNVTQNIYANETSYAKQQREAAKNLKLVAREVGAI